MHFSTTAFVDSTFVGPKMVVFFLEGDLSPILGENRFLRKSQKSQVIQTP